MVKIEMNNKLSTQLPNYAMWLFVFKYDVGVITSYKIKKYPKWIKFRW